MLQDYINGIFARSKTGDATEPTYYSDLENLINKWATKNVNKKVSVTPLPKKTEAGNPDFRIWDGKQHIIGYIEAKAPTVEDLRVIETTDQLKRYRSTFPNLMLTNFLEWRLYRDGELIDKVMLGRPLIFNKARTAPQAEQTEAFDNLLSKFFSFSIPKTYTAKTLATELAKRTRFLRDEVIAEELRQEEKTKEGDLYGFYHAFKEYLISSLTTQDFADLYSQTITYGLFAARMRADGEFNRQLAVNFIPHTIGVLRDVFKFISSADIPASMEWMVDDIAEVLAAADPKNLMHKFYQEGKGSDPIIHFYETFLAAYDPTEREKRGVYYTPEPVVSYIVRSVHHILKSEFEKSDGLASTDVTVLDPAAGTLTFLAKAAQVAADEFLAKYGEGGKERFMEDHILRDFYAFELMMAPYAVGHLKMGFLTEELGYNMKPDERFKFYLTNTLEMEELPETKLPGIASLSKESHLAARVKKEQPILVIMGNPPYSVSSTNTIKANSGLDKLYETYKTRVRTEEKNIQPLSDDYIKFLAFAHWKVKSTGHGVIGMITNNSYLDGLIHRDMRRSLLEDFDQIYVLNLHGHSGRKETTTSGGKDENVFDIRQGVAIIFLVKLHSLKKHVRYDDLWGLRGDVGNKGTKYDYLATNDIASTRWHNLKPSEPHYFFTVKDFRAAETYDHFLSLEDIFVKCKAGIATGKDEVLVDFDRRNLIDKLSTTDKTAFESKMQQYNVDKDLIPKWYQELANIDVKKQIIPYCYRPFDSRFVLYNTRVLQRARNVIMQHLLRDNLALLSVRQYVYSAPYSHALAVKDLVDRRVFISNRGAANVFPLYLYESGNPLGVFPGQTRLPVNGQMGLDEEKREGYTKTPNLHKQFLTLLTTTYSEPVSPEDIFYYIYAVLYSNTYRQTYEEFLKIGFPRIPFSRSYDLFKKLGILGRRLVELHLLDSKELDSGTAKFQCKGDNKVKNVIYKDNKVCINETQFFAPVSEELYTYYIGGYQILNKWLKDRRGQSLSTDDIKQYCKIVSALKHTIHIQQEIEKLYPQIEKNLLVAPAKGL